MIALIGTVVCSTFIFVIFRIFERFNIGIFQAIIANYFTAFFCGILVHSNQLTKESFLHLEWVPFVAISSVLFITLFMMMAISAQKNGIAATSVAVKMSMAVSMIGMIFIYNESISITKLTGIFCALVGVFLIASTGSKNNKNKAAYMLVILFIGSGFLDLNLNPCVLL
jgi:drug/metabolite transporter (DMT)-like permease